MRKVHFVGICGSGQAAVAIMAKKLGFEVDGCDSSVEGYYYNSLQTNDISVKKGHSKNHLDGVDICAVSPAVFEVDPNNEEVVCARERGILMTWQEFVGKYIYKDKTLVSVSGTHGKSTATVMLGRALEELQMDPSVLSGSIYKEWKSGCRIGASDLYVCEADEFNRNFWNYESDIIVINNLEMDHPECFSGTDDLMDAFSVFIKKIKGAKVLIVNAQSRLLNQMLTANAEWISANGVHVVGYYAEEKLPFAYDEEVQYQILNGDETGTEFKLADSEQIFKISLLGRYNVENALSVICALRALHVEDEAIARAILPFRGVNRRFELIGNKKGVSVFDDYAHHPTAIRSVLTVCNQIKRGKVWAVFEPHQISRLTSMFDEFAEALALADCTIITKTHLGREINSGLKPIAGDRWIHAIGKDKTFYLEEYEDVIDFVCGGVSEKDIVIVIGAGESFKISRGILEKL